MEEHGVVFNFEECEMGWDLCAVHEACPVIPRTRYPPIAVGEAGRQAGRPDKESIFPKREEDSIYKANVSWQMRLSTAPI